MSYAICRVQKIKGASSVHGIQGHQRRERESNTNPDIDYSRKNLNYSLIEDSNKSFNALADERIKQAYTGKKAIRKDAVRVVSGLFTSDNTFFQGKTPYEHQKFFNDCFQWSCERWGKDNIISAVVHMDEKTPHLHIEFVPLTADGRLSAKAVLGGKVDLQHMQDDFHKKIGKPWGLDRGERADLEDSNAPKPQKHLETAQIKRRTALELEHECKILTEKKNTLKSELDGLQIEKATLKKDVKAWKRQIHTDDDIDEIGKKQPFVDRYTVDGDDLEKLKNQAKGHIKLEKRIESLENNVKGLENKLSEVLNARDWNIKRANNAESRVIERNKTIEGLETEVEELKGSKNRIGTFIKEKGLRDECNEFCKDLRKQEKIAKEAEFELNRQAERYFDDDFFSR